MGKDEPDLRIVKLEPTNQGLTYGNRSTITHIDKILVD